MSPLVEVLHVEQQFRSGFLLRPVTVLKDVSFSVKKGDIFGFLGPNGAGKTTLIQLLVGLRQPTRGTVLLGGLSTTDPRARQRLGYLPERPYFYEHLTGRQFLSLMGSLSGIEATLSSAEKQKRAESVLELTGLARAGDTLLRNYSKGMLQRIGFAQAILHRPEIIVLDEPMSGLDPVGRKEVRELLHTLAKSGMTVFFSTHVIPDVEAICDQVAIIDRGQLVKSGSLSDFLSTGPLKIEIAFSGPFTEEKARSLTSWTELQTIPQGWRGTVTSQTEVDESLRSLLHQSAQVLWVQPVRASLEDWFSSRRSA